MRRILFIATVLCMFLVIKSQDPEPLPETLAYTQNPCTSKTTCGQCIQTPNCAWCMQENFGDRSRCYLPDLKIGIPCEEEFVIDPANLITPVSNRSLSRGGKMIGGGIYEEGMSYEGEESYQGSMSSSGSASSSGGSFGSASGSGSVTQIRPQHVQLKMRISEYGNLETKKLNL